MSSKALAFETVIQQVRSLFARKDLTAAETYHVHRALDWLVTLTDSRYVEAQYEEYVQLMAKQEEEDRCQREAPSADELPL